MAEIGPRHGMAAPPRQLGRIDNSKAAFLRGKICCDMQGTFSLTLVDHSLHRNPASWRRADRWNEKE